MSWKYKKNDSWKLELEKGDFIAGIEHDEAEARRLLFPEQYRTMPRRRDFEFAELQYFAWNDSTHVYCHLRASIVRRF